MAVMMGADHASVLWVQRTEENFFSLQNHEFFFFEGGLFVMRRCVDGWGTHLSPYAINGCIDGLVTLSSYVAPASEGSPVLVN